MIAFVVGSVIAYSTAFKARGRTGDSCETLKSHSDNLKHDRKVDHVPLRAYAYAALALLAFADFAADALGEHVEQQGRDDGELVRDWTPSYAQRWREHERLKGARLLPLFAGVVSMDALVRYSPRRSKQGKPPLI